MNKYIWVVNALDRAGRRGLTLKQLNDKWQNDALCSQEEIKRQTFNRWKIGILDTMGVMIECDLKNDYRYYISNPDVLASGELSRWLLNTYTTYNSLTQNMGIKDRILTEEIPSSQDFLTEILDAMRSNKVIEITYKNFIGGSNHTFSVAPYCVKMSQRRWYMLGLSVNENRLRVYSLDRLEYVDLLDETFKLPKDFDANEYFSSYFGVVHDESIKVERIVLRAYKYHHNYLRTLPLHFSQKEIFSCEDYADFELYLRPTYDFLMELSRYGTLIEVLKPQSIRETMHSIGQELLEMYKND